MQHLKRIGYVVFKKFNTFNRYRTATDDDGRRRKNSNSDRSPEWFKNTVPINFDIEYRFPTNTEV